MVVNNQSTDAMVAMHRRSLAGVQLHMLDILLDGEATVILVATHGHLQVPVKLEHLGVLQTPLRSISPCHVKLYVREESAETIE